MHGNRGFTLIETALVLFLVGSIIAAFIGPLGQQLSQQRLKQAEQQLSQASAALQGFAAGNGRLPCPATRQSSGIESPSPPAPDGSCDSPYGGFLPARQLGLGPQNTAGLLLDPWGNPIRYAVATTAFSGTNRALTLAEGIRTMGIENFSTASNSLGNTTLQICLSANGVTQTSCGPLISGNGISADAVLVLYSYGPSGPPANGPDEIMNNASSALFVYHTSTDDFDHIVQWISRPSYLNHLIAAGRLP